MTVAICRISQQFTKAIGNSAKNGIVMFFSFVKFITLSTFLLE